MSFPDPTRGRSGVQRGSNRRNREDGPTETQRSGANTRAGWVSGDKE